MSINYKILLKKATVCSAALLFLTLCTANTNLAPNTFAVFKDAFTKESFTEYIHILRERFIASGNVEDEYLQYLDKNTDTLLAYILDNNELRRLTKESDKLIWTDKINPLSKTEPAEISTYISANKNIPRLSNFWYYYQLCIQRIAKNMNIKKIKNKRTFNLSFIPHIALENAMQHNSKNETFIIFGLKDDKFFFSVITPTSYSLDEATDPDGKRGTYTNTGTGLSLVFPNVIYEFNSKHKNLIFDVELSSKGQTFSYKKNRFAERDNFKGSILTFWIENRPENKILTNLQNLLTTILNTSS